MCNDYRLEVEASAIFEDFAERKIKIWFSEGTPNIQARQDIKITDSAADRAHDRRRAECRGPGAAAVELAGSERSGRSTISAPKDVSSRRVAALLSPTAFMNSPTPADKKKKRKDKWLFTKTDEPIFCIAGIWRETKDVSEAFTMLTMSPGPDIAPYHDRQIVILERDAWAHWLDPAVPAQSLIKALPAGSIQVEQVG